MTTIMTPDLLNDFCDQASDLGKALEAAENSARSSGKSDLANQYSQVRGALQNNVGLLWNRYNPVLLSVASMQAVSQQMQQATAAAQAAAANLAQLTQALGMASQILAQITKWLSFLPAV